MFSTKKAKECEERFMAMSKLLNEKIREQKDTLETDAKIIKKLVRDLDSLKAEKAYVAAQFDKKIKACSNALDDCEFKLRRKSKRRGSSLRNQVLKKEARKQM